MKYYIGIDIGGMSIKGGLCSKNGEILSKATVKTNKYDFNYSISEDIKIVIDKLLSDYGVSIEDIEGIGIGSPGSIDSKHGIIRYSNNIAMTNVPVIDELKQWYNVPMFINNDANCAALGETKFGSGKGCDDVIFITLGTGVGSGIIIDGKLFEGKDCAGAEAGHTVIISGGNQCNCGRHGCWETYASAAALINQTRESMAHNPDSLMHKIADAEGEINGKVAFTGAKQGDKAAISVINQYIDYISEGLINLANIFRPEIIIIGGGISYEGAFLTDRLNELMSTLTYGSEYNPKVTVKTAELANDAGILGAMALAL